MFAGLVAGVLDRLEDRLDGGLGALEPGSKAALVADGGGEALLLQHGFKGVEGFGDGAQALGEGIEAFRHDHELLEINGRVGVGAAVDDVGHGDGEDLGVRAAEIFKERKADRLGRRLGGGEGNGQDRVGAKLRLGLGAVQAQHRAVNGQLVESINASERGEDFFSHVPHGSGDAFA